MKQNIRSSYIDDIEILRAFAILLVFFTHMKYFLVEFGVPYAEEFYYYFRGGKGVDLFFVISGFVITRSLLPKLQSATNASDFFRRSIVFWIRRFWRLAPSGWLWLIIPLLLCVFFNQSGQMGTLRGNFTGLVAGLLNVFNFYFAKVFNNPIYANSVFVQWTLSLEAQFYFIFPFIIFLARKRLPIVLFILVIIQLIIFQKQWIRVLRTDAFFIGVLIAIWQQRKLTYLDFEPTFLKHPIARILFIGIIFLGLLTLSGKLPVVPQYSKKSFAAIISAVAVLVASYNQNYLIRTASLKKIFLWIGARSYAIYLIHIPVNNLIWEVSFRYWPGFLEPDNWLLLTVVFIFSSTVLTCIISELNFRFIEEPFRIKGRARAKNYFESRDNQA